MFNRHPHNLAIFSQINQDVFIHVSGLRHFLITKLDIGRVGKVHLRRSSPFAALTYSLVNSARLSPYERFALPVARRSVLLEPKATG